MPSTQYKSGSFIVPGSTGDQSITGLGFQPAGVFFFGTNATAGLDSVTNVSTVGMFGGMMALDWDSSTILEESVNFLPVSKRGFLDSRCIRCEGASASPFNGLLAHAVSLDADGFTISWEAASPSGTHYVHYLAWGGGDNAGAEETYAGSGDQTLSLGWRVKSVLTLGGYDSNGDGVQGFPVGASTGDYCWWGSGSYPVAGGNLGAYAVDVINGQQRVANVLDSGSPATVTENYSPGVAGTILGGQLRTRPSGGSFTDLLIDYVSTSTSYDITAFWDGESSSGLVTPTDTAGAEVVETMANPLVEEVAAVLFFTTGDTNSFGTTLTGNLGFGVATLNHQACCYMDGSEERVFQSITKGWCCDVDSGGAVAGTVALEDQQMTLTTTDDGGSDAFQMVYIAFGPDVGAWIPHIYRWVLPVPVPTP